MMMFEVVFGVPGGGKTTYLLDSIDRIVEEGTPLKDIAYLTMTRNARKVARKRMMENHGATKDDLHYFRTMHSICYELLGYPKVVKPEDYASFCADNKTEYKTKKTGTPNDDIYDIMETRVEDIGALYLSAYDWLRVTEAKRIRELGYKEFRKSWIAYYPDKVDDTLLREAKDAERAYWFLVSWEERKARLGKVDYIDMLLEAYRGHYPLPTPVLVIDEFQDFSPLMYQLYLQWKKGKKEVIIAGDDDQAIYSFIGADPSFLLTEKSYADKVTILNHSHRLPPEILNHATTLIQKNKVRMEKNATAKDEVGMVLVTNWSEVGEVMRWITPDKDTLFLARTNWQVSKIAEELNARNIPYNYIDGSGPWSDKFIDTLNAVVKLTNGAGISSLTNEEFARLIDALPSRPFLRRGIKTEVKENGPAAVDWGNAFGLEFHSLKGKLAFASVLKLTDIQRGIMSSWGRDLATHSKIRIGTIHKAKGDEADFVYLHEGLTKKIIDSMEHNYKRIEEERRVRYVGLTRAKKRLVVLEPDIGNVPL